jgi:hypothetical protein
MVAPALTGNQSSLLLSAKQTITITITITPQNTQKAKSIPLVNMRVGRGWYYFLCFIL